MRGTVWSSCGFLGKLGCGMWETPPRPRVPSVTQRGACGREELLEAMRWCLKWIWNAASSSLRNNPLINFNVERTEKLPMGSIKNVVSEPIEGHEDYHMMVSKVSTSTISHLIPSCKYPEWGFGRGAGGGGSSTSSCAVGWECGHGLCHRARVWVAFWISALCIIETWGDFTPTLSA